MTNWILFFFIIQVIHFLGTWKLYKKAGREVWEAAVPIYNAIILTRIINRPWWWVILLFIPIVNLMMFPAFWVETARSFGKEKTSQLFIAVFTLGFYNYYLNYIEDVTYQKERQLSPFTKSGEWVTSIVFAIIAATLVHTYFMRPYTIPTSSLEKSLLVGDYLFVSKFHYGARTPKTAIAFPMVHDTIPIPYTGKRFRSYVNSISAPNFRFPGFQKIKRNDIVVFNWPTDTVRFFRDNSDIHIDKPLDKKSNYVKRCVGIPGDSLELRDGYVFINGKQTVLPDRARTQFYYTVDTGGKNINLQRFLEKYNVTEGGQLRDGNLLLNLTKEAADFLKSNKSIKSITRNIDTAGVYNKRIFPHDEQYKWSKDNYGPLYIPKKGETLALNSKSIPFYQRVIEEYEGNNLTIDADKIYINGELADSYTFKQNYYWMMGDNRHNSEDARYWGYVPFDHVVGKPVFLWFSIEPNDPKNPKSAFKRIRKERLFTTVHASGEATSYLPYFLGFIILFWGYSHFRKKKIDENIIKKGYPGVSERIKAVIIDQFFIIIFMFILSLGFSLFSHIENNVKVLALIFTFILYDPIFTSIFGGTIGHMIFGIRVKKDNDQLKNISFPYAVIRFIIKISLGWISLLTIYGNEKGKAIHDYLAKSVVVYKNHKELIE